MTLIPYCLANTANKAIRPDSSIMRVNGRGRSGHSFALDLLNRRQLRRQRCRLMTAFIFGALCLNDDNGHILRDSVAVEELKCLIKAKDDIDMASTERQRKKKKTRDKSFCLWCTFSSRFSAIFLESFFFFLPRLQHTNTPRIKNTRYNT